jgi:hypothetical protein
LQLVKKFPAFMKPESSSPYPQVPATCPYPEPTPSCPHEPLQLPEDKLYTREKDSATRNYFLYTTFKISEKENTCDIIKTEVAL